MDTPVPIIENSLDGAAEINQSNTTELASRTNETYNDDIFYTCDINGNVKLATVPLKIPSYNLFAWKRNRCCS